MKKLFFASTILLFGFIPVFAQYTTVDQNTVQTGEIGFSLGAAHYFGDLNPKLRLNRPKPALGVFVRKQFGSYVAVRINAHFAQLGYSDIYNSYNQFMHERNLSFNTNIWEITAQGDFNFFKYVPGDVDHSFTPYLTVGVGTFNYNPYAYYQGQKVFLRPLGTEGQGSAAYPNRKTYGDFAVCFPIGVGIKYSINPRMNFGFEIVYRITTTDYIDDVSKTYAGAATFPNLPNGQPSLAGILQDRSYVYGTPIGIAGRQRGYENQRDSYVLAEVMLSFNLTSYRCPTPRTSE
jgi:hypothetical protein